MLTKKQHGALLLLAALAGVILILTLAPNAYRNKQNDFACFNYGSPCYQGEIGQDRLCRMIKIEDNFSCVFYRTHPECKSACTCFDGSPQQTKIVKCGPEQKGMCQSGGCVMPNDTVLFFKE